MKSGNERERQKIRKIDSLNLSPHGQSKQHKEITNKDRPIDRYIEYFACSAQERDYGCAGR